MRWVDTGEDAHGIIAVGRVATGIVAVGQVAHGAIAVGQFAFGLVAVGQVAVGATALGTVAVAPWRGVGLAGLAGTARGLVLPLLPSLGTPREPTPLRPLAEVADGSAWAEVQLDPGPDGTVLVFEGGAAREIRLDARLARATLPRLPARAWVHLRTSAHGPVIDAVRAPPVSRLREPGWWVIWSAQIGGLLVVCALVWWLVVVPLTVGWFGTDGVLVR